MNNQMVFGVLLMVVGIFSSIRIKKFYNNPQDILQYVEKSPKAYIWRKMFGVEKTIKLTKSLFSPVGLVISIISIFIGIALLLNGIIIYNIF